MVTLAAFQGHRKCFNRNMSLKMHVTAATPALGSYSITVCDAVESEYFLFLSFFVSWSTFSNGRYSRLMCCWVRLLPITILQLSRLHCLKYIEPPDCRLLLQLCPGR